MGTAGEKMSEMHILEGQASVSWGIIAYGGYQRQHTRVSVLTVSLYVYRLNSSSVLW